MKRRHFAKIISGLISSLAIISGIAWISKLLDQQLGNRSRRAILDSKQVLGNIYTQPEFWVFKKNSAFKVLSRRCPHLGCTLQIKNSDDQIFCPCHGSHFKLDGSYLKGPAKKDLKVLEHRLRENGSIEITLDA